MKDTDRARIKVDPDRLRPACRTVNDALPFFALAWIIRLRPCGLDLGTDTTGQLRIGDLVRGAALSDKVPDGEPVNVRRMQPGIALRPAHKVCDSDDIGDSLRLLKRQEPQRKSRPGGHAQPFPPQPVKKTVKDQGSEVSLGLAAAGREVHDVDHLPLSHARSEEHTSELQS